MNLKPLVISLISLTSISSEATVIHNLNFNDSIWSETLTVSGMPTNPNSNLSEISADGTTITADEGSGGAGSGVRIVVALNTPLSTVGYENIEIVFTGSVSGALEYDTLATNVSDDDGFSIIGDGVNIITDGIEDTAAETDLLNSPGGTVFSSSSTSLTGSYAFNSSADNSAITNLVFTAQVNATTEVINISNVQIVGDAVPEPHVSLLAALSSLAIVSRRRRN